MPDVNKDTERKTLTKSNKKATISCWPLFSFIALIKLHPHTKKKWEAVQVITKLK